jgi:hypothetical protein
MRHNAEHQMSTKPERKEYTRREAQRLTPEIMGCYHDLVMAGNLSEFERLLDLYQPGMDDKLREQMIEEFKHYAARIVRHRWRLSK